MMILNKNDYLDLVRKANNEKMIITKQIEKDIRNIFREVAKDLEKRLAKSTPNSLNERWLYDYRKELNRQIDLLTDSIYKSTKDKLKEVIEDTTSPQLSLFNSIDSKYSLGLEKTFKSMFSRVNKDVLSEILRGGIYKDNRGLSERLWLDSRHIKKDIQQIILEGIASKKSAYDLAKDLEKYVNPDVKKDWDWSKVYPGARRKIDYNAQRLARTSINHAYQMATKRSCKDNPFVEGIKWHSAMQHGRTCELCMSRHEQIYKAEEVPYDHPNGVCTLIPHITKSFEDIGTELRDWVDGEPNVGIDKWMKVNGHEINSGKSSKEGYGNKYSDKKQYEKYKEVLGKDLGVNRFEDFQNIKYNDTK